jgi:TetR/AcrR family transcriptional regulator
MAEKELSRKEREHLARRNEILQAALKLFSQKGFQQTSISEIAKEAQFSIGSLYGFFKNKEDLFLTLFNSEIEEIENYVISRTGQIQDLKERTRVMVQSLFEYFEGHWEAFNILALNRTTLDLSLKDNIGEVIHNRQIQFLQTTLEWIREGIDKGVFRPFRAEEMALCFMGLINGSILMWIESGRTYSLKERSRDILDIFYRGVEK